jgi:hypothetical protein
LWDADHNAGWANLMPITLGDGPPPWPACISKHDKECHVRHVEGQRLGSRGKGRRLATPRAAVGGSNTKVRRESTHHECTTAAGSVRGHVTELPSAQQGPTTTCRSTAPKHMLRAVAGCSERQRCYSVVQWLTWRRGSGVLLPTSCTSDAASWHAVIMHSLSRRNCWRWTGRWSPRRLF